MKTKISILLCGLLLQKTFAQNIGIGITTPTRAKLEVVGVAGTGNTTAIFGGDGPGISLQTNLPSIGFNQYRDNPSGNGKYMASGYAAVQYFDPATGYMAIDMLNTGAIGTNTPNGYRAITFSGTGVGIRYPAPNASLAVSRGEGNDGTVVIVGQNASYWSHFNYSINEDTYIRSGVANGTLRINSTVPNGNVLIGNGSTMVGIAVGSNAPLATLHLKSANPRLTMMNEYYNLWEQVVEGSPYTLYFKYDLDYKGYWSNSNGIYMQYSDRSLKKDIQPLEPVLEKIKKLKPVLYEMINNNPGHKRSLGFIAQEVKPLFPGQVHVIDDHARKGVHHTDLHTMNYSQFHVIAVKALQEQYAQIKELEKEQEELLEELLQLQKRITAKKD